ncbi:MAG: methylated-DNA--[protein]-cysteine S-methyltransferase [Gammaproteobacteria bacterium]|nr:methylated-DNA--[protein]-cysteine S-methyltransferase [Gammaproteobacteria bacterium]
MVNRNYQKIWKVVTLIPEGNIASYGQVADLAGLPGNARLVGRALGRAPAELSLPWHRVVNARRQIAFPVGSAQYQRQKARLAAEGVVFTGRSIPSRFRWQPDLGVLLWQLEY